MDATPGCKQRRSWHIRKHSYPISQTYRTCNALLKLTKDTSLGGRNEGSWRKHILTAIEECQKMHSHCTGPMPGPPVVQEVSTDVWLENLAPEAVNVTSVLQLGSSPGCSPAGHWPKSHAGIWQAHALLLSTGALGDLPSLARLVDIILRILNSGFLNLLLQMSSHQKCLQA